MRNALACQICCRFMQKYWSVVTYITGWPQTWKTWNTPGFLWTCKSQGFLREFCATSGKNSNKQSIFSSSFKYLVRVQWWRYVAGVDVEWPLMKVIITFTFCCDKLWKCKFMALEKLGKLGEFFSPTLWPPCVSFYCFSTVGCLQCFDALGWVSRRACISLLLKR